MSTPSFYWCSNILFSIKQSNTPEALVFYQLMRAENISNVERSPNFVLLKAFKEIGSRC